MQFAFEALGITNLSGEMVKYHASIASSSSGTITYGLAQSGVQSPFWDYTPISDLAEHCIADGMEPSADFDIRTNAVKVILYCLGSLNGRKGRKGGSWVKRGKKRQLRSPTLRSVV